MATLIYARERAMWIRNHAGPYNFQRRRADLLMTAYDDRKRLVAGTDYNRHVQAVTEKLRRRFIQSLAGWEEALIVAGCAVIFPVAWPLGRLLYLWLVRRVELARAAEASQGLWSIPITALAWISVALELIAAVVIDPSSATTFLGVVLPGWILTQGAGVFLMASVYGVLEGWVAVPGTTGWWPFPPPKLPPAGSFAVQSESHTAGAPPPPGMDKAPKPFRLNKKTQKSGSDPKPWA